MKIPAISKIITPCLLFSSLWLLVYYFYPYMDANSKWGALGAFLIFILMGYYWIEFGILATFSVLFSVLAFWLYDHQLILAEQLFILKYFLASQVTLLWMSVFFFLSFFSYLGSLFCPQKSIANFAKFACRIAIVFGMTAMLVRWYESYLMSPDIGHVPIASFFEVMIWLMLCCALLFLWLDKKNELKAFGLGSMTLIVVMIVGLLLDNQLNPHIQPLMPALQSAWMKLHVPTSFIGYAGFGVAAVGAVMFLLKQHFVFWQKCLPSPDKLTEITYRATVIGFLFFALGIITGSLWAAQAWGSYWQWDPKETWALIVWLNYAAWLHYARIKKSNKVLSVWSIIGWGLSLFAFIGVNRWLPGLHSYAV